MSPFVAVVNMHGRSCQGLSRGVKASLTVKAKLVRDVIEGMIRPVTRADDFISVEVSQKRRVYSDLKACPTARRSAVDIM